MGQKQSALNRGWKPLLRCVISPLCVAGSIDRPQGGLLQAQCPLRGSSRQHWIAAGSRSYGVTVGASPITQASAHSVTIDSRLALPPTAARFVLTVTSVPKRSR